MSIKPIDFQVMIPRANEVSKISSDDTNKNLALQQQQATSTQHKAENSLKQVYSQTKPQGSKINEKQKENRKDNQKEGKKKEQPEHSENNILNSSIQTSTIDIKI
jgi:hypothetical protein